MKKLFSILAVACLLFAAPVQPRAQQNQGASSPPFTKGEELVYHAEFNRALLRGVDVGEFRFSSKPAPVKPGGVSEPFQLVADVVSKGFFTKLAGFRFHQHVESAVNLERFSALKTNKLDEQGKRVRISEAIFDYESRKVTWTERDPNQNQPPKITALDLMEPFQDVLSMIYFLRTQHLEVGKSFEIPVTDSGRMFRLSVAVMERKRINTVLGRVHAVRIEPAIFGEDRMIRSNGKLSIWITDDSRHLPVWAQVKLNLGTVDIKLKSVNYTQTLASAQK
ncbi:MAG: DUF3108 domain-containing protein [Acidobacteriota bacterium]